MVFAPCTPRCAGNVCALHVLFWRSGSGLAAALNAGFPSRGTPRLSGDFLGLCPLREKGKGHFWYLVGEPRAPGRSERILSSLGGGSGSGDSLEPRLFVWPDSQEVSVLRERVSSLSSAQVTAAFQGRCVAQPAPL